jgi:hypothetical protein
LSFKQSKSQMLLKVRSQKHIKICFWAFQILEASNF